MLRIPKVQVELDTLGHNTINETGDNSEATPSVSPQSPRSRIGPKLGDRDPLALDVKNVEGIDTKIPPHIISR